LSDAEMALCIAAAERSGAEIDRVGESQHYGLIHCDIHPWNCLFHEGKIGLIDFDDCRLGSFVEDIAITLTYFDDRSDYKALRAAFFDGYTQVRALPPNYRVEVEAFMVSRGMGLVTWILSWPSLDHYPFGPDTLASALRRAEHYMAGSVDGVRPNS
jgi:Ser/Thr protein kinase RdoA (MazF antagonist)